MGINPKPEYSIHHLDLKHPPAPHKKSRQAVSDPPAALMQFQGEAIPGLLSKQTSSAKSLCISVEAD